jgi:hypothetical protein
VEDVVDLENNQVQLEVLAEAEANTLEAVELVVPIRLPAVADNSSLQAVAVELLKQGVMRFHFKTAMEERVIH